MSKSISTKSLEEWHTLFKKRAPVLYFLTEELPRFLRRHSHFYRDAYYFLLNRYWERPDIVKIENPEYSRNHYHDRDPTLLFVSFQVLTDFVEIECANMQQRCHEDRQTQKYKMRKIPIIGRLFERKRDPELGIQWLLNKPENLWDIEIADLYLWWKVIRPKRGDSMDVSGLSDLFDRKRQGQKFPKKEVNRRIRLHNKIEKMWLKEDKNKLKMLAEIREALWT